MRQLRPRGVKGREVGVGDLRAAQEVGKAHARACRRGAARGEHRGERGGRREVRFLQPGALGVYQPVFFLHGGKARVRHQPDAVADGAQALVGVILPVQQTVLRAGGHDAVRLVRALGHEIVHERADVPVRAAEDHRRAPEQLQRRVHARNKALHCRLLIAGRAVELPRSVETGHFLGLQRRQQLRRVDAVIFDRVGAAGHLRVLEPRQRVQHLDLHILRKGGGEALNVELLRVEPHRFDEQLVARLVGEGHDLRLDRRAVARSDALDHAGVDRAAVEVCADDGMCALVGIGKVADSLVFDRVRGGKRERLDLLVARLQLHVREVDCARIHARRRAGLEAAHAQPQRLTALGERPGGGQPVGAGIAQHVAHDRASAQVCARGEHGGAAAVDGAVCRHDGADMSVLRLDGDDLRLLDAQVRLQLERVLHHGLILAPVGLRAQRVHGRALAAVEHPVLDAGPIGRACHLAAERIELAHKVALARAADGGVAGHVADGIHIDGKADGVQPEPGGGQRGLNARVPRADDGDVTASGVITHDEIPPDSY